MDYGRHSPSLPGKRCTWGKCDCGFVGDIGAAYTRNDCPECGERLWMCSGTDADHGSMMQEEQGDE